ncbi:MAG TPA: hypothetical protein PKE69_06860 [Pyrinomonadaceae bacterium]|nr:hypothetical protein [Pyrinomonadaceae bacterium]
MVEENENNKPNTTLEKVEGIGQIIVGEIEKIGGILTGDSITQAEGEFNISTGTLREQAADALEESEDK